MLRESHGSKPARAPDEVMKALTPDEFYHCSERAYRSALRLAAFCEGVTPDSLKNLYQSWCDGKEYLKEGPLLGDEEELILDNDAEDDVDGKIAVKEVLSSLQTDAELQGEMKETSEFDLREVELKSMPDAAELKSALDAVQPGEKCEPEPQSPSKGTCSLGVPMNLHHALWGLAENATEPEVFDSLWRLVAYCRHWCGGCDREFIKDPRTSRRRTEKLNWYQQLDR